MIYIKTYEWNEYFYVIYTEKDNIKELKNITDDLLLNKIPFKVLDSGTRNKKYYYVVFKEPLRKGYEAYVDHQISDYGDEVDYKLLIEMDKYNL